LITSCSLYVKKERFELFKGKLSWQRTFFRGRCAPRPAEACMKAPRRGVAVATRRNHGAKMSLARSVGLSACLLNWVVNNCSCIAKRPGQLVLGLEDGLLVGLKTEFVVVVTCAHAVAAGWTHPETTRKRKHNLKPADHSDGPQD
jgi:hypothetical protein